MALSFSFLEFASREKYSVRSLPQPQPYASASLSASPKYRPLAIPPSLLPLGQSRGRLKVSLLAEFDSTIITSDCYFDELFSHYEVSLYFHYSHASQSCHTRLLITPLACHAACLRAACHTSYKVIIWSLYSHYFVILFYFKMMLSCGLFLHIIIILTSFMRYRQRSLLPSNFCTKPPCMSRHFLQHCKYSIFVYSTYDFQEVLSIAISLYWSVGWYTFTARRV